MTPASAAARTSGFALVLLLATALIELFVVAFAAAGFDEVAEASPFGRAGTVIAAVLIGLVAVASTAVAWRGAAGAARAVTAAAAFVAVGILVVMALFFLVSGGGPIILAVLLALTAVSIAMIGRAVLQPARGGR